MPWDLLLCIFSVIVIVCDGKDPKTEAVTLKILSAHDDTDDNTQDTFKIIFESTVDVSTSTDIKLELVDPTSDPPFEKELESALITVDPSMGPNMYYAIFNYMGNDIDHDVHDILEKSFTIVIIIKDGGGITQATGTSKVDLSDLDEFPSSSACEYVEDSDGSGGGWVRIASEGLIIAGSSPLPACESAPCYAYQDTLDTSTEYRQCEDVQVDTEIYFCSDGSSPLTNIKNPATDMAEQIILDHAGQLQVTLASDKKDATKVDLVIHKSSDPDNIKTCGGEDISTGNEATCTDITIEPDKEAYKILLVGYADDTSIKWTVDQTDTNHELQTAFIIPEILEVGWDHNPSGALQNYFVTRSEVEPDDSYHEANVDCSAVGDPCFSYFIDIKNDGDYSATLQNCDSADCNTKDIVTIKSEAKHRGSFKLDINILSRNIDIKMADNKTNFEVCFEPIKNISMIDCQYEFLLINSQGQWKRTTEVHMESDSVSCFHAVEMEDAFLNNNSTAFVLLRDTKNRRILASAQVKIPVQGLRESSSLDQTGDNINSNGDGTVWMIVGASVGFLACLVALVAVVYTKFIRKVGNDNGIEHPLHSTFTEDSNVIHAFDNPIAKK